MKLTIIMPVYNVEKYVGDCIESILRQQENDWELIIINDGSTDSSSQICHEYADKDTRIIIVDQANQGVSVARNKGIEKALGEWILFIDSDDILDNNLFKYSWTELNDENDICYFQLQDVVNGEMEKEYTNFQNYEITRINKQDIKEIQKAVFNRDRKYHIDFYKLSPTKPPKFFKSSLVHDDNIRFIENMPYGEDAVFNLYYLDCAEKGVYIKAPLYYSRVWPGSVSKKYNKDVMLEFDKLHQNMEAVIRSKEDIAEYIELLNERILWSLGFGVLLDFCHKDNPCSYKDRKCDFMRAYNQYEQNITAVDLKKFRIKKRIVFYIITKKDFFWINFVFRYLR